MSTRIILGRGSIDLVPLLVTLRLELLLLVFSCECMAVPSLLLCCLLLIDHIVLSLCFVGLCVAKKGNNLQRYSAYLRAHIRKCWCGATIDGKY